MTQASTNTMLLVGAGILVNPWAPVIDALKSLGYEGVDCGDSANFRLATEATWARMQVVYAEARGSSKEALEDVYLGAFERVHQISKAIEEHLSRGTLVLRPEFREVCQRCVPTGGNDALCVVTTNWDTVLDEHFESFGAPRVFHLHGKVGQGLYLPSEVAWETYRPQTDREFRAMTHAGFHKSMFHCHRLILYGISLSPLDAELAVLIQAHAPSIREAVIIDPDHSLVAKRLRVLRGRSTFPIKCWNPHSLDSGPTSFC